jgi:hypothetical protein
LVALAALAACSDTTAPTSSLRSPGAASLALLPDVGPVQITLVSSDTTHYCGSLIPASPLSGNFPTTITTFPDGSCTNAPSLETSLETVYNPGWSAPLAGSQWIGPQSDANFYTVKPGTYKFNTYFTLPAGVTSPVLNVNTLSDNLVAVYLNDHLLDQQVVQDCVAGSPNCNWQIVFTSSSAAGNFVTGQNKLTFYLVDTPIGLGKATASDPPFAATVAPYYNCQADGPQQYGRIGFSGAFNVPTPQYAQYHSATPTWDYKTCLNPSGLDYRATVSWVPAPPPPSTTWCSPGFWKNHPELWTAYHNTMYSTLSGAAPFGKKAPSSDANLLTVISNPSIYGGPATNSVADFLSNKAFGTPIGSGVESCPDPSKITVPAPTRS